MNFQSLEKHMVDTIKEWHIKLGFNDEHISVYYPKDAVIRLLELPKNIPLDTLPQYVEQFLDFTKERLGDIKVSYSDTQICFDISCEGNRYVAKNIPEPKFLKEFLNVLKDKNNHLEQVREFFHNYAKKNNGECIEKNGVHEGMGYAFYFNREDIDPYVYCVEDDIFGLTYHRFTKTEYQNLCES